MVSHTNGSIWELYYSIMSAVEHWEVLIPCSSLFSKNRMIPYPTEMYWSMHAHHEETKLNTNKELFFLKANLAKVKVKLPYMGIWCKANEVD